MYRYEGCWGGAWLIWNFGYFLLKFPYLRCGQHFLSVGPFTAVRKMGIFHLFELLYYSDLVLGNHWHSAKHIVTIHVQYLLPMQFVPKRYTVLTKSKLTPRKMQITLFLYLWSIFFDQCISIRVPYILSWRQILDRQTDTGQKKGSPLL